MCRIHCKVCAMQWCVTVFQWSMQEVTRVLFDIGVGLVVTRAFNCSDFTVLLHILFSFSYFKTFSLSLSQSKPQCQYGLCCYQELSWERSKLRRWVSMTWETQHKAFRPSHSTRNKVLHSGTIVFLGPFYFTTLEVQVQNSCVVFIKPSLSTNFRNKYIS